MTKTMAVVCVTGLLAVAIILVGLGYLLGATHQHAGPEFDVEVITVNASDLPLCDATHTTNCAASKVDWETLQVHSAPGWTRTVVGDKFLPNAKR